MYNDIKRHSECVCDQGYEGDGKICHVTPECTRLDDCGGFSHCDDGVCTCNDGYERDVSDL